LKRKGRGGEKKEGEKEVWPISAGLQQKGKGKKVGERGGGKERETPRSSFSLQSKRKKKRGDGKKVYLPLPKKKG